MSQESLFHERIEQAIDEVISFCGGRKRFAAEMWPEKAARDAHNLLDACLNPERREKFAPDQLIYILRRGRQAGCHALMRFLNQETGYEAPKPIKVEDAREQLQREFIESVQRQAAMLEEFRRLGQSAAPTVQLVGKGGS